MVPLSFLHLVGNRLHERLDPLLVSTFLMPAAALVSVRANAMPLPPSPGLTAGTFLRWNISPVCTAHSEGNTIHASPFVWPISRCPSSPSTVQPS